MIGPGTTSRQAEWRPIQIKGPAVPLIDRVLGPAWPTSEVLDTLDRQYREQGKAAIGTLPLDQPIAPPHLDELLGEARG